MFNTSKKNGFSLIETLVSIGILLFISALSYTFIVSGFTSTRFANEQEEAIINARKGIETTSKWIRGANSSQLGDYPLDTIDEQDFTFYSDVDDDGQTERVRYMLDGTNLNEIITEPGLAGDYLTTPATTTISEWINNQGDAIFYYFDNEYNETAVINDVRLIKIFLMVNVTPNISPNDYIIETDVHLRNLKDNL